MISVRLFLAILALVCVIMVSGLVKKNISISERECDISLDQAQALLERKLQQQGNNEYYIEHKFLLKGKMYRFVKTPYYLFGVIMTHHQGTLTYESGDIWYVNGLTGEVGQADDFPEIRASLDHE